MSVNYPIKVEVGKGRIVEANNTGYTIHTVTSGRIFKLETLIITNRSGDCEVNLYDAASGGPNVYGYSGQPQLRVIVGAVKTEAMGDDFIKGKWFASSVVAFATVSGTFVHVGGNEYAPTP
jgi:hypothetical protein